MKNLLLSSFVIALITACSLNSDKSTSPGGKIDNSNASDRSPGKTVNQKHRSVMKSNDNFNENEHNDQLNTSGHKSDMQATEDVE